MNYLHPIRNNLTPKIDYKRLKKVVYDPEVHATLDDLNGKLLLTKATIITKLRAANLWPLGIYKTGKNKPKLVYDLKAAKNVLFGAANATKKVCEN